MCYKVDYITIILVGLLALLILTSFNGCVSSNVVYKYIENLYQSSVLLIFQKSQSILKMYGSI